MTHKSFNSCKIFSIIILTLNICLIICIINNKAIYRHNIEISKRNNKFEKAANEHLKWTILQSILSVGFKSEIQQKVITNGHNNSIYLDSIINSKGLWVFRFFNNSCFSCYESSINIIRSCTNNFNSVPLIILTDYKEEQQIKEFISKTHLKSEIFSVDKFVDIPFETLKIPYISLINNDGYIIYCLPLEKTYIDYFQSIIVKLMEKYIDEK